MKIFPKPEGLKALQKQLGAAIRAKNLDETIRCVEGGADIHEKNSPGRYYRSRFLRESDHFIIQATFERFVEGVKYLLEEGADPEPEQSDGSVMASAAYQGEPAILQAVLDFEDSQGARSQQRSYEKALEIAADCGRGDCCRMLMERRGAKLGACFYTPDVLWFRAASKGHIETLKLLEESGLRPKDEDMWFETMKQAIWGEKTECARSITSLQPQQAKANAHRAFAMAVDYNRIEIVQMLLDAGCDPNLPDDNGNMAVLAAIKQDNQEMMRLLLHHGALPVSSGNDGDIQYIRGGRAHSSKAAMMMLESMTSETPKAREFLLMMVAKSIKDGGWEMALATIVAAERLGHKEAVLGCVLVDGCTPLARSIDYGDMQFTRFFIKQGSDLDVRKTSNGDSIMHMAVRVNSAGIVQMLLEKTQDKFAGAENKYGNTPLHLAASGNYVKIMRLLLMHGADPAAENNFGVTPRDMALEKGSDALEELLVEKESTWSLPTKSKC
ncbi:MAG: hypothetical protein LQ340_003894 [Diploschistes diacapsis]|nr:MAG: hypothetical protein LQ340_003894 [Diploschistes diacapsis]